MNALTYIDPPNQNLVCCICRNPFLDPCTNRTCSHTFCRACILQSLSHSQQCPIDRSPLRIEDIHSADPIVRSLVDELLVKCPNEASGCSYTCQRQLVEAHIKMDCQYTLVPCPKGSCEQEVFRKDSEGHICAHTQVECEDCDESIKYSELEAHSSVCPKKFFRCEDCESEQPRSSRTAHASSCYAAKVGCTHEPHGCPWRGRRKDLPSHISSCPYEAIKGFFALQEAQKVALNDENTLLKQRIGTLESQLRVAQFELRCAQSALGPWFRNSRSRSTSLVSPSPPSQLPMQLRPNPASTSHSSVSPPDPSSITQYFPDFSADDRFEPGFSRHSEEEHWPQPFESDRPDFSSRHAHRASFSGVPNQSWQGAGYLPTNSARSHQNVIAPLNLNTSLEGSLEGLRESIVALSTSLDSLGRRSDIALTNETLRLNEEIMSLRATLHGLRMQVHTIMMDRNAQVTGRGQGMDPLFMPGDGHWMNMNMNAGLGRMQNAPPNSITKL